MTNVNKEVCHNYADDLTLLLPSICGLSYALQVRKPFPVDICIMFNSKRLCVKIW